MGVAPVTTIRREFFSYCRKSFAEEHFFVAENLRFQNFRWTRGIGVARFYVVVFFLAVPEFFVGEPCAVSKLLGCRKVFWIGGEEAPITIFRPKVFVSQYRNIHRRTLLYLQKLPSRKILWIKYMG